MSKTIDDFRDFFKPEKQKIEFDVGSVIKTTLDMIEPTFIGKDINIKLYIESDIRIEGYPNELGQAILNIVKSLHEPDAGHSHITTLLITQFPEEALMADRLIIFNRGRIAMDDSPRAIFERAQELEAMGLEPPLITRVHKMLAEHIMY